MKRYTWSAWLLIIPAILIAPQPAGAVSIIDPFGFSSFSFSVDHTNQTITVNETIDAASAGFTILFEDHTGDPELDPQELGFDDLAFNWQVTKNITNSTASAWQNFDNELKVSDGAGGFQSSDDFDGTSFNQGNPNRVIDSIVFNSFAVDEFGSRDFIQFQSPGTVNLGGSDTQTFPITSFSIRTIQLVQTPNFLNGEPRPNGPSIPEPTTLLLFSLGTLGAGLTRRRFFSR